MPELVKGAACKAVLCGFEPYRRLIINLHCGVEQRPARQPHKLEVVGSSPAAATKFFALVAQLEEQLISNQFVVGSSPIGGARYVSVAQ